MDSRIEVQLEEDEGDSIKQSWMERQLMCGFDRATCLDRDKWQCTVLVYHFVLHYE